MIGGYVISYLLIALLLAFAVSLGTRNPLIGIGIGLCWPYFFALMLFAMVRDILSGILRWFR